MLLIFRRELSVEDFRRLESLAEDLPYDAKWARRRDRLVLRVQRTTGEEPDLQPLVEDESVAYVLRDPSEAELSRLFSRRDLLDLSLLTTGVLAGGALLAPMVKYLSAPSKDLTPGGDVYLTEADSILPGRSKTVLVGDQDWLVIRTEVDRFHALSATCTHSDVCQVRWERQLRQVVCPCHRGVFDMNGSVLSGPPPRPLEYREVVERDGDLYLKRRST